jgi:hypothetical protein
MPDGGAFELRNDAFYRNDRGKFTKLTADQVGPIVADGKQAFRPERRTTTMTVTWICS